MLEINGNLSKTKEHPVATVYGTRKLLKSNLFLIEVLALRKGKLLSSFNGKFFLITLTNTFRGKSSSHRMRRKVLQTR